MPIDDTAAFSEKVREAVLDCRIAELVAERMRETQDEISISLPIDVFFEMHGDDLSGGDAT